METIEGVKSASTEGGESTLPSSRNSEVAVVDVNVDCILASTRKTKTEEGIVTSTKEGNYSINPVIEDGLTLTAVGGEEVDEELLEGEKTPLPNFCVEGSGQGDSAVTVAAARGSSLTSIINSCIVDSCCLSNDRSSTTIDGGVGEEDSSNSCLVGDEYCCGGDDDATEGNGSAPISIQSSEDMKLSLVSWYSEPEETPTRDCCKANLISQRQNAVTGIIDANNINPNSCCSSSSGGEKVTITNNNNNSYNNSDSRKSSSGGDGEDSLPLDTSTTTSANTNITTIPRRRHHHHHHDNSEEEKTPMRFRNKGNNSSKPLVNNNNNNNSCSSGSHRLKMHVQLFEQNSPAVENCKTTSASHGNNNNSVNNRKMECPRCCARRSKSGTTTPAVSSKTPSRRVVQSSKSSQELKKPIKSILRSSTGSGGGSRSGSGSEKQSSMDSLGSASGVATTGCVMIRSDGSGSHHRTKFNFNSGSFSSSYSPDEKTTLSKLKRIEKYATLRISKSRANRPLDFGSENEADNCCDQHCCAEGHPNGTHSTGSSNNINNNNVTSRSTNGGQIDIMSKSMSFLEKSSNHSGGCGNSSCGGNSSSSLKRQGSLRIRKQSPMWEPSGTRTQTLRMQKMQEAKNKTGTGGSGSSSSSSKGASNNSSHQQQHQSNYNHQHQSGSNHSGSGEAIHIHHHHHHHGANSSSANYGHNVVNGDGTNCRPHTTSGNIPNNKDTKHCSAKVFTKLSSASGQTASSAMKRLKQERGVQTDQQFSSPFSATSPTSDGGQGGPFRISPVPTFDQGADEAEQIKNLEILAQRYRTTALRFQHEYEKSEQRNRDLLKQLQEVQSESSEMIDFLQAEKSTLAESLNEVENEGKKLKEQVDSGKKEAQSRCSSLVRLSEQHKQEALKSQALLSRLEAQSNAIISKQSGEISDAALEIQQTRQRIITLMEKLLKTYKVPRQLLASATAAQSNNSLETNLDESDLNSSLLLPLVNALINVFPLTSSNSVNESNENAKKTEAASTNNSSTPIALNVIETSPTITTSILSTSPATSSNSTATIKTAEAPDIDATPTNENDNSLHNLNQAILEREAAEKSLGSTQLISSGTLGGLDSIRDGAHLPIKTEIEKLNVALAKFVTVIRIIVIQCDKKVSGVASNILQCLRSMEEEKAGTIPDMVNVQKSLEAWNSKPTTSTLKIFQENGQSHS